MLADIIDMIVYGDYEWDEWKARENLRKHGVSFEEAIQVFDDPFAISSEDKMHSTIIEQRYNIIGLAGVRIIIFVAYTTRNKRTRIISAREAEEKEAAEYAYNFAESYGNRTMPSGRTKSRRARHKRHSARDRF